MANIRWHWARRAKVARQQRQAAHRLVAAALDRRLAPPFRITLTRRSPGCLDDDNLAGALKHVRDGVADALDIDDGDRRLAWRYLQERSRGYAVRVEIEAGDG